MATSSSFSPSRFHFRSFSFRLYVEKVLGGRLSPGSSPLSARSRTSGRDCEARSLPLGARRRAEMQLDFFTSFQPIVEATKLKLVPLNEGGTAELLNKEILRLQEENEKLKSRLKTAEVQATNALDKNAKLERALQDLQLGQGKQEDLINAQDLSDFENTVAALKSKFEKTLNDQTENQKSLEENLVTAKHDLLRAQGQLSLAEKELEKKFQQTAAYRNMKEILTKKNDQIKELRRRLAKYESED